MIIVKIILSRFQIAGRAQWMQTMLGGGGREEQPSPPETFAKINFDQILIKPFTTLTLAKY